VLTDSEVDSRFFQLVADLNSTALAVDWPCVSDPAEQLPSEDPSPTSGAGTEMGALRLVAAIVALVTFASGIALTRVLGLGVLGLIVWFVVVVPGAALLALLVVDRLRRT
jgi:hypothetical protein